MNSAQVNEHSRYKLAQLWHTVRNTIFDFRKAHLHNRIVNKILDDDFNINLKITVNADQKGESENHLKDCTALHFLYYKVHDIYTFTALVERGADVTLKNANGQTALHLIITTSDDLSIEKEIPFIDSVLSAHVKLQNPVNPHDDNNCSHLHGACIADDIESVELFLNSGASIDESVNFEASRFAGYTPLHFAVKFCSFKAAEMLVKRGANLNVKDAKGMNPLDLVVEGKLTSRTWEVQLPEKDPLMKLFLENNAVSSVGLSSLQIACTLKDLTIAERLLDEGADIDYAVPIISSVYSGFTALHFAAGTSIEAVKMLLLRGAKIHVTGVAGLTPLDVCMYNYSLQDMSDILSCDESSREIRLLDGETRLSDLIATMDDLDRFRLFLTNGVKDVTATVPEDSVLWPGYTILHLAVKLARKIGYDGERDETQYETSIVEECLSQNLNLNIQDARGRTPIHLAYLEARFNILDLLLDYLDRFDHPINLVDENNLSYLYIACAMADVTLVEKLLGHSDPNIVCKGKSLSGSTPLHVVTTTESTTIAEMLLRHGADLHAADDEGLAPIHCLLKNRFQEEMAEVLLNALVANPVDRIVESLGLTYLHVACFFGDVEVVEKLLDLGSNVNAVIKDSTSNVSLAKFNEFSNLTPLQMAIKSGDPQDIVLDLLLCRGADMFVKGSHNNIPMENKDALLCFFKVLWKREDLQRSMEEKLGLTKLHVACYLKDEEAVTSALENEIDVNARVHDNSEIFAGCTPLHLLMTIVNRDEEFDNVNVPEFNIAGAIDLLADRGADVMIKNGKNDTPIHVFHEHWDKFIDAERCVKLLLKAQKNFSVNPANNEGLTHCHIACVWLDPETVEKFLLHDSVDIDQPIGHFAKNDAGCTPLHMALSAQVNLDDKWTQLSRLVDLLLKHGANVAAKDVYGDTPLHKYSVLLSPGMSLLEKLVSHGGSLKSENVKGQTPIDMWPSGDIVDINLPDYVTVFRKYGCNINSWNRLTGEGHVGKIFLLHQGNLSENSEFEKFLESSDVRIKDDLGRTVMHNLVAHSEDNIGRIENYLYATENFVRIRIDIDCQDKSGQTALHYAARMENTKGVEALLACGADTNIIDSCGKSAFSYAVEHAENKQNLHYRDRSDVAMALRLQILKLQHLNIEVCEVNERLMKKIQHYFEGPDYDEVAENLTSLSHKFFRQIEMTKTLDMGLDSLTLRDFLSETGAATLYPLLSKSEQQIVVNVCNSINYNDKYEIRGVIVSQFTKMGRRLFVIGLALNSLRTLLGFSVPNLCENISRFLSNSDLVNVIKAYIWITRRKRKFSEMID